MRVALAFLTVGLSWAGFLAAGAAETAEPQETALRILVPGDHAADESPVDWPLASLKLDAAVESAQVSGPPRGVSSPALLPPAARQPDAPLRLTLDISPSGGAASAMGTTELSFRSPSAGSAPAVVPPAVSAALRNGIVPLPLRQDQDHRPVASWSLDGGVADPPRRVEYLPGLSELRILAPGAERQAVRAVAYEEKRVEPPGELPSAGPWAAEVRRLGPFEVVDHAAELQVVLRRSKLLRTRLDVSHTAVADTAVCQIVQFTPREVSIVGKAQGATHVTFWFQDEQHPPIVYLVRVVPESAAP